MLDKVKTQTAMVCDYIAGTREREFPDHVMDEAKKCLVDWAAVCIGAYDAPEGKIVASVLEKWATTGNARLLRGGTAAAGVVAMVNATLSHCLDYDDTHIPSVIHVSGPLWAAILAVGSELDVSEALLLKAFITGFEVAARIGDNGIGIRMNNNGWHSTPAMGRVAVAGSIAVIRGLNALQISNALGIAATQAGGLTAAFGTMSKPFQIGKTAMDGIMAAELAQAGLTGPTGVLDEESGFVKTLLQDAKLDFKIAPFDGTWEITRNSFKAYAACQLTHAAIDAARAIGPSLELPNVKSVEAHVNPLTLKIADVRDPRTTTEAKFSTAYCVALGLKGYAATMGDFDLARVNDPEILELAARVHAIADDAELRTSARLSVHMNDGTTRTQRIEHALGSIGNPLGWPELEEKFLSVVKPSIGNNGAELLQTLRGFEKPGSLAKLFRLSQQS